MYQDTTDKTVFSFIEEWKDMESLKNHMKSSHYREVFPKLEKLYLREMEVNFYTLVE
ncbi:putative quinol monooxygenase [Propionigenium maris]|uniref:putative quinol monooxygenase n=1 Tax=Propionigenium maris TaxID=45622 RepID=UPI0035A229FE